MTPEPPYVTLFLNKPNYLAALNRQNKNNLKSTELKTLKCQFDENWHPFFPHFFAQNNQSNRKTFFDVNKIGYNHSSGREKLLQTYEFPVRH